MSHITFNKNEFPWNNGLIDLFNRNSIFNDDFFTLERSLPAMNVLEHKEGFEIELASPSFDKKDFEITVKDDVLEVSAKKSEKKKENEDDYTRKEFNYFSFRRSLRLPKSIDDSKDIKATYENGILKLYFLKKEEVKKIPKRKIEVV